MLVLIWLLLVSVQSFTPFQIRVLRNLFRRYDTGEGFTATDSVLSSALAYAEPWQNKMYIDGAKLGNTPNTFANVAHHETLHLTGATHRNGHPLMNYTVRLDPNGRVLEDPFVL